MPTFQDAFISYGQADSKAFAIALKEQLKAKGLSQIWLDLHDIPSVTNWQERINEAIGQSHHFIYVISPSALDSIHCQKELALARQYGKRIIPLMYAGGADVEDRAKADPILRPIQWIWCRDNLDDPELFLNTLSRILHYCDEQTGQEQPHLKAYVHQHTTLLIQALSWESPDHHRETRYLLVGTDRQSAETWLQTRFADGEPLPCTPSDLHCEFIAESLRQPPELSLDVFISYSRVDSDFARRLNDALQTQGKRTWFDQESIATGTDFQQEIYRGIESSDVFVFVLSPESVTSPFCADEVEYAQGLNKRMVTVLHRPIDTADLHPVLAKLQWLDFRDHDGDFQANFAGLLRTLDTDRAHLETHTRLLVRSGEWDRRGRDESLLLRGQDLATAETWLEDYAEVEPKPTGLQQEYIRAGRAKQEAQAAAEKKLRRGAMIGAIAAAAGILVGAGSFWVARIQQQNATDAKNAAAAATQQAADATQLAEQAKRDQQQAEAAAKSAAAAQQTAETRAREADGKAQTAAVAQLQAEASAQVADQKAANAEARATDADIKATEAKQAQILAQTGTRLERAGVDILSSLGNESAPSVLAAALIHAESLKNITNDQKKFEDFPAISPIFALQSVLDNSEYLSFKAHQGAIYDLSFSSDRLLLATLGGDGYIKTWRLQDNKATLVSSWMTSNEANVSAIEIYGNTQKNLLTISKDGYVQKWDTRGQELSELKLSNESLSAFKILRSNDYAAVISTEENKSWMIDLSNLSVSSSCDLPTQTNLWLSNDINAGNSINPNGVLAFPLDKDDPSTDILLIDLTTCQKIPGIQTGRPGPLYTTFSPNGERLGVFIELRNIARIYDFSEPTEPELISLLPLGAQLCYDGDIGQEPPYLYQGTHFSASKGGDDSLKLWDSAGRLLWDYRFPNMQAVYFGPNDFYVAVSTLDGIINLRYFPPHDNRKLLMSRTCFYPEGVECSTEDFTISPGGDLIAWLTSDGRVITSAGEVPVHDKIGDFHFGGFTYKSARFTRSDNAREINVLATDKTTGSIILLRYVISSNGEIEALGGTIKSEISFIKDSDVAQAALSKNGQKVAVLTMNGILYIWDIDSGDTISSQITVEELNNLSIPEIEFGNNSHISVSFKNEKLVIIDILSRQYVRSDVIDKDNQKVAFDPNDSLMYIANANAGTVSIVDSFGNFKASWQAHQSSNFLHIKITPDGSRVVTLGQEGDHVAVKTWTPNGQLLGRWRVTTGRRSDAFLAMSLNGKSIAAQGNLSGDISQVWELETLDELISRGCERLENYHQSMLSLPAGLPESCDVPSTQSILFESSLGRSLVQVQVTWPEQG